MRRILIVGNCGVGKSTFAKKLSAKLNIPLHHLDQYYWSANWQRASRDEWSAILRDLMSNKEWILDGNFKFSYKQRLQQADTVLFLDYPLWQAMFGICKRWLMSKFNSEHRTDLLLGCKERISFLFIVHILLFPWRTKPLLHSLIRTDFKGNVVVLKNSQEAARYLKNI